MFGSLFHTKMVLSNYVCISVVMGKVKKRVRDMKRCVGWGMRVLLNDVWRPKDVCMGAVVVGFEDLW